MDKNKFYIGAHATMALGFENALKSINVIGGNSVQVFLKSPRGRFSKTLDADDVIATRKFFNENEMFLVGHSSYLLNFAKEFSKDSWAVESLIDDMKKISVLGGVGVVLHIGKYLDMEKEQAYNNIKKAVSLVIEKTPDDVLVIFENTAGQGTEIGYKFEELKNIYDRFSNNDKKRIGFCLDTCHSHAAGYDLSTKEGVIKWKNEFDKNIGWDKVVCIHFNDSKKPFASKIDRHEDLTFGTIGIIGLEEIAKIAKQTNKPLILETTTENLTYKDQIEMVKSWMMS